MATKRAKFGMPFCEYHFGIVNIKNKTVIKYCYNG